MIKYQDFELVDFVLDESFQQWVLSPTQASDDFWKSWIAQNPERKKIIDQAKAIIKGIDYKKLSLSGPDKASILDNINARIKTGELKEELSIYNDDVLSDYDDVEETVIYSLRTKRKSIWSRYPVAAIFIGVIIIAGIWFFSNYFMSPPTDTSMAYLERSNPSGIKSTIRLEDGTVIKLNAESKLTVPPRFSEKERKVALVGEAYFEVAEDEKRPFIVTSGNISTIVLGTAFNVRAYPDENNIEVAVANGKVVVKNTDLSGKGQKSDSLILLPDEMAVYSKSQLATRKSGFDFMKVFAWKDDVIYFKDANVYEILETLEKWYGVTFIINRALNENKDFTVSYRNKPLKAVLEGLSFVFVFEFDINGKVITIN
ncbi:FecR domain-containing protein [Fulvivirgaceae bacterium BMA12]|uniref:FecR domain-containing protein n=1 Tax=Agaribacillus aureus TaxID=3051825 RepID=A0ABT8L0X1_9BACT|nr:FecR domain-containing protein [Fulvivirgaceae bacterium BMA12]